MFSMQKSLSVDKILPSPKVQRAVLSREEGLAALDTTPTKSLAEKVLACSPLLEESLLSRGLSDRHIRQAELLLAAPFQTGAL
jgi:hypothetical protein